MELLLKNSGMAEILGKFTDPALALEFLKNNSVDAAFLDAENGYYAVEASHLDALDFLMKPVTADRLKSTLDRIIKEKSLRIQPIENTGVVINCFGKFRITNCSSEVKFRTEKAEELIALLIDKKGCYINRSGIIDCLWEEYEGDRALTHFNTTLYYVKRALLQHGIQVPIEHDRGSYRFDVNKLSCDYCSFIAFASKIKASVKPDIQDYERTAELYTGDYLSGSDFSWAERNRQILKDIYIGILLEISEYYRKIGSHRKTVEWMNTGLVHEPLHRELNYRLVEALLLLNDRVSAVRYFDIYRDEVRKKLRQEPDEGIRKLLY